MLDCINVLPGLMLPPMTEHTLFNSSATAPSEPSRASRLVPPTLSATSHASTSNALGGARLALPQPFTTAETPIRIPELETVEFVDGT